MAANTSDKITDTRNAARPVSTTVSSGRSAGGNTLACASLTGWPTASKVHFVTYQIDSNSNPVAGTQLDCRGIVSGSNITSFSVLDGTDTGNSVGDIVEMLPTASWGQDLADALTAEHSRTGTHAAITATSINNAGTLTQTGVATFAASPVFPSNSIATAALVGVNKSQMTTDSNPYKFSASSNTERTSGNGGFAIFVFEDEDYDTNSNYDATTGIYTAPVAGFYHFDACTHWDAAANDITIAIYKNGAEFRRGSRDKGGSAILGVNVSADMQLAASDTIAIYIYGSNNTSDQTNAYNYFNGHLLCRT